MIIFLSNFFETSTYFLFFGLFLLQLIQSIHAVINAAILHNSIFVAQLCPYKTHNVSWESETN